MLVVQKNEYATDLKYARLASEVPIMSQNIAVKGTFLKVRLLYRILIQPHAQMLSISNMLNKTGNVIRNFSYYGHFSSKENIAYIFKPYRRV